MRCEIVDYPSVSNEQGRVFRCIVHGWTVLVPIHADYQCPIGRIENARDAALDQIDRAAALLDKAKEEKP